MQSQLCGQSVRHISFGEGVVADVSDTVVTINFSQGDKKFVYPEAFSKFLILKDLVKQNEISAKYNKILQAEEAARKLEYEKEERLRLIRTMKIDTNSQAVFNITPADAKKAIESGSVSTGFYLSGNSKGDPRIPSRIKPNSVCLLTGIPNNKQEKDRCIFGAFMVQDDFWGEQCKNGVVDGHDEHRVYLPSDMHLSYWDYFDHDGTFPRWGNVPFKYFSISTMQKILHDMIGLLNDKGQESGPQEFYQYFCKVNRLATE